MAQEIFLSKLLKPLCKKLLQIKEDQATQVANIGKEFGDPFELAKLYVEPNCQHGNPADYDDIASPVHRPLFDSLNDFMKGESHKRDGRNHLFILGDAGMGKTSALLMLRLSHLYSFWPKPYKCHLLKLGSDSNAAIANLPDPANTVLLLDALDEDRAAWTRTEDYISNIIRTTLYFKKVIISCRTQFFPQGERDVFNRAGMLRIDGSFTCPVMYLSLFNDDQVHEYLSNKFTIILSNNKIGQDSVKIKSAKQIIMSLHSLKFRPLILSYIDDIIEAEFNKESLYDLYSSLITVWLQRECSKMKMDISKLELACIFAAYEMLQGLDARTLSELEVDKIKAKHPEIRLLNRLEIGGRSLLNRNSEGRFRFSHYTIQEFMVAKGIIEGQLKKEDLTKILLSDMIRQFLRSFNHVTASETNNNRMLAGTYIRNMSNNKQLTFKNCNMVSSEISQVVSLSLIIDNSNMYYASLSDVNTASCEIKQTCLARSVTNSANMQNSIVSNVKYNNAVIVKSNFSGTLFDHVDFSNTNISECDLSGCKFEYCNFEGTQLNKTKVGETKFKLCKNITSGFLAKAINSDKALIDNAKEKMKPSPTKR